MPLLCAVSLTLVAVAFESLLQVTPVSFSWVGIPSSVCHRFPIWSEEVFAYWVSRKVMSQSRPPAPQKSLVWLLS